MSPLFSIVIANYNYGRFLEDAIRSVLSQGMGDKVELIICDAASTDNSVDIIRKYEKDIAWWCSERDGGQSAAFNKGFSHAKGKFLTWLNADDVFLPGALKAIAQKIKAYPNNEWFVGSSMYVDKDLKVTRWFRNHRFSPLRARYGFLTCGGPSSFFTKRLLDEVGGIDESLHFLMDIDLWYRFYQKAHVKWIRTTAPVFAYRIHEDSKMSGAYVKATSAAQENRRRAQAEYDLVCRRYGAPGGRVLKLATILSFSLIDKLISRLLEWRHKGKVVFDV